MPGGLDFKRWAESIELDLGLEFRDSSRFELREILSTSRQLIESVRTAYCSRGTRRKHTLPSEEVERFVELGRRMWGVVRDNPCSKGEIRLADFLMTHSFWLVQVRALDARQMTLTKNEVINKDFEMAGAAVIGTFEPWFFSIFDRVGGLSRTNFLYRAGYGPRTTPWYFYRAYRRFLRHAKKWAKKKKYRSPDASLRTLAVRFGLRFLMGWAGVFSVKAGGPPRPADDFVGLFIFWVLKNVSYRDPVAVVMALQFFQEYVFVGPRLEMLTSPHEVEGQLLSGVDENLRAAWDLVWEGLGLETFVRRNLAKGTDSTQAWREVQSTLAMWSWWGATRGDLDLGGRLLERYGSEISVARPWPAAWIWEMCRLRVQGVERAGEALEGAEPAGWQQLFDEATARDVGVVDAPYAQFFQALAASVPVDSFAMSVYAEAGNGSSVLGVAMRRSLREALPVLEEKRREQVLSTIQEQRQVLAKPLQKSRDAVREQIKRSRDLKEIHEEVEGGSPVYSKFLVEDTPSELVKADLTRKVFSRDRAPREGRSRGEVDELLDLSVEHGVDLVYVGFFGDGIKLLHCSAREPAPGRVLDVHPLTRRLAATFISDAWQALTYLPAGRDYESEKEEAAQALVSLAQFIAERIGRLPLGPRVLIVPANPLQYLPLLPVLTLEVLIPREAVGAVLEWAAVPARGGGRARYRSFRSAALSEFGALVDIRREIDWTEVGLEGEVLLDPSVGQLAGVLTSGADVVHVATHGFFDQEFPLFSGLAAMDWWSEEARDAPLFVAEMAARRYDTELAVLAACSTNPGGTFNSDLDLSLSSILVRRGVRTVLGALWRADSLVSNRFTSEFKGLLGAGFSLANAYAGALAELAATGFEYRWLPFQLTTSSIDAVFRSARVSGELAETQRC